MSVVGFGISGIDHSDSVTIVGYLVQWVIQIAKKINGILSTG
jgi:hypothetical protein